jgi:hypothetical protein
VRNRARAPVGPWLGRGHLSPRGLFFAAFSQRLAQSMLSVFLPARTPVRGALRPRCASSRRGPGRRWTSCSSTTRWPPPRSSASLLRRAVARVHRAPRLSSPPSHPRGR